VPVPAEIRYALSMIDDIKKTLWASAGKLRTNMKLTATMAEIRALSKRAMYVGS